MVDRKARDQAAKLLLQFKDGEMGSGEFADSWPGDSPDPALRAICEFLIAESLLQVQNTNPGLQPGDLSPKLKPGGLSAPLQPERLTSDGQAMLERCILFLKSGLELDPRAAESLPQPPLPHRRQLRAAASLILLGVAAMTFVRWGFSPTTLGLLMLWGLLWAWLYHFAERAFCSPPEGWSIGTVFWPFTSREEYEQWNAKGKTQSTA